MSEVDHRRALTLVRDVAQASSCSEYLAALLPGLQRTVGADEVTCSEISTRTWKVSRTWGYPTTPYAAPQAAAVWSTRPTEHPWVRCALQRDQLGAVRLSDLCSRGTLQRLPYYQDFYRLRGIDYADYATIAEVDGTLVGIGLNRSGRDFSAREHDVLEHLRRPLGGLWAAARRAGTLRTAPAPASSSGVTAALSPAERRVTDLVGKGLSNQDVATALGVSRKAVEQHLTRVYRKLGVRSRSQLVRLLLTAPDPGPSTAS